MAKELIELTVDEPQSVSLPSDKRNRGSVSNSRSSSEIVVRLEIRSILSDVENRRSRNWLCTSRVITVEEVGEKRLVLLAVREE